MGLSVMEEAGPDRLRAPAQVAASPVGLLGAQAILLRWVVSTAVGSTSLSATGQLSRLARREVRSAHEPSARIGPSALRRLSVR